MKISNQELKIEKNYLIKVKEIIKELINKIEEYSKIEKEKMLEKKREIYIESKGYDSVNQDLIEEIYNSEFKIDMINKKIDKIVLYEKALNNPYFGKIIYTDSLTKDENEIYIGLCSIEKDYHFYVYDWRSKIASLFYNYELGDAIYKVDDNFNKVNIKRKIQFNIKNGELIRCFDSSINIDDDYLQDILANSNNDKLSNIVSSIQKEQNEIIRNDKDKNLIVQGFAGSGKTVVALHRIAYLLYKDINLNSKNFIIISPNDIFTNYISDVLPSLGEENTLSYTITGFFSKYLKEYKLENYQDFLKRINELESKDNNIDFKLNGLKELNRFLNKYISSFKFQKKFKIKDKSFSSNDINYMFNEKYNKIPLDDRFKKISEYICMELDAKTPKNLIKIKEYIENNCNLTSNIYDIYNLFLKENNIDMITYDNNIINYEDITNLLFIYFFVYGYDHDLSIKHIVIDEAQDYTIYQIRLLKKIFSAAQFTILGDINQSINTYNNLKDLKDFGVLFRKSRFIELTKTYRSTKEIIDYSNKVLNINNICTIRNNSEEEVEVYNNYDLKKLESLIINCKKKFNKIAIITDNDFNAKKIFKQLNNVQLVNNNSENISKDIIVIPSYLSKGLEFDCVIVYSDTNIFKNNKKLFYVSITRAHHKLIIINN